MPIGTTTSAWSHSDTYFSKPDASALGGGLPGVTAPHKKTSLAAQRTGGHPKIDNQEGDGRSGYPKRSRRPRDTSREAQRCHATATSSLHRSWWTLDYARSGNRQHSVHPCRFARALLGASLVACSLSSDAQTCLRRHRVRVVATRRSRSAREKQSETIAVGVEALPQNFVMVQ